MNISWLTTSWSAVLMIAITAVSIYVALIFITRIVGLRSFSQMSTVDFAITIAVGAIIAGTILTQKPPLLQALLAAKADFSTPNRKNTDSTLEMTRMVFFV